MEEKIILNGETIKVGDVVYGVGKIKDDRIPVLEGFFTYKPLKIFEGKVISIELRTKQESELSFPNLTHTMQEACKEYVKTKTRTYATGEFSEKVVEVIRSAYNVMFEPISYEKSIDFYAWRCRGKIKGGVITTYQIAGTDIILPIDEYDCYSSLSTNKNVMLDLCKREMNRRLKILKDVKSIINDGCLAWQEYIDAISKPHTHANM